jgi:uncharacterized protein YcgI (DUF1989 family)
MIAEDTSPGVHDTLIPACDPERYRLLGAAPGHASCAENFKAALRDLGVGCPEVPDPPQPVHARRVGCRRPA